MTTEQIKLKLSEVQEAIARKEAAIAVSILRRSRIVHKRLRGEVSALKDLKSRLEAQLNQLS